MTRYYVSWQTGDRFEDLCTLMKSFTMLAASYCYFGESMFVLISIGFLPCLSLSSLPIEITPRPSPISLLESSFDSDWMWLFWSLFFFAISFRLTLNYSICIYSWMSEVLWFGLGLLRFYLNPPPRALKGETFVVFRLETGFDLPRRNFISDKLRWVSRGT